MLKGFSSSFLNTGYQGILCKRHGRVQIWGGVGGAPLPPIEYFYNIQLTIHDTFNLKHAVEVLTCKCVLNKMCHIFKILANK